MANLLVPDFKTSEDFVHWVENLDEKRIQSWKTEDWLTMYEKLSLMVDNDEKLKSEYREYIKEYKQTKSQDFFNNFQPQHDKNTEIDSVLFRQYFTSHGDNLSAFVKLYTNYRFEPQQLRAIKELAKQSGKKISENPNIDLSEISGVMNSSVQHSDDIVNVAGMVDELIRNSTDLPNEKTPNIYATDAVKHGYGETVSFKDIYQIRYGLAKSDAILELMFHESAHAHLQNFTPYQQSMLTKGKLPLEQYAAELNKDFYELMRYNNSFYVRPDFKNAYIASVCKNVNITKDEYKGKLNKYQCSYKKQPMERYSYIFGIEADREFRHQRKQHSERNALLVKNYLWRLMGVPVSSKYTDGNIKMEYNSSLQFLNNDELINRFNYLMEGAAPELLKTMNIHEEEKNVVLTIPSDFSFQKKINAVMQKNARKNNLFAYKRNKLAKKIDKAAASVGINSNLQDFEMPKWYKHAEGVMSVDTEKRNLFKDYNRKKFKHLQDKALQSDKQH